MAELPPADLGASSANEEEEPTLKNMISIFVDVSSRQSVNEQCLESLMAQKEVHGRD